MAMTKTSTLTEIRVQMYPSNPSVLLIEEQITIDDPDDDQLPLITRNRRSIAKQRENSDGVMVNTDISGEEQVIQDIAAVVWA